AEAQIYRCIRFREENKGQGSDKSHMRFMLLGQVRAHQGRAKEAEEILRNVLEDLGGLLGPNDSDALECLSYLASVMNDLGKYDESETMNRHALEVRDKALGNDHPDTLTSLNNLAFVLQYQGKYGESETMHRCALEGREK
ncbi:unnamed protein product, partial [Tuber aestivum]